jgi:cysteine desulfurase
MTEARSIYLDHAATTPLDRRVLDAILPFLGEEYGNASSPHGPGRRARFAVEDARERVAAHLGAEVSEIVFTSGGTEANNLALWALARGNGAHLGSSAAEHESVLEPLRAILASGVPVNILDPTPTGAVDATALDTIQELGLSALSVMHTNNETGALNSLPDIATWCRNEGLLLHSDCVQALGWTDLDVDSLGVDLMTVSAHKIYGPKGAGALFVRGGTMELEPFVRGGSQERRRRGGTENVSAIVGMAVALDLAVSERDARVEHLLALKNRLAANLVDTCPCDFVVNTPAKSAPHILNVSFPPVDGAQLDGEMLLLNLDVAGVHVSSGSACTSGALEPSHVLRAMGVPESTAAATIRFSVGAANSPEDMDYVSEQLGLILRRMQSRSN